MFLKKSFVISPVLFSREAKQLWREMEKKTNSVFCHTARLKSLEK